jgi:colicin import membrane protein
MPAATAAPVVSAPPAGSPPPSGTLTPEAEVQARELLQKQWNEIEAAKVPAATENPPSARDAEKRAKADAKARQQAEAKAKREMEKLTADANSKARVEARKRTETEATSLAESRAKARSAPGAVNPSTVTPSADLPATGLNDSKQQRLAALLETYRQNQITPAEYHEKRARILAEP